VVVLWALAALAAGRALVDDERQHAAALQPSVAATAAVQAPTRDGVAPPAEPGPRRLARDDAPGPRRL
jgi:hypothetical protein